MGLSGTPLTPVNAFTALVYPPDSGSPILAADVEAGEQALLNRTLYLQSRLGEYVPYTPQVQARATYTSAPYYTNATTSFTDTGVMTGVGIGTIAENDLIEVTVSATMLLNASCSQAHFRVTYKNQAAAFVQMPGMYCVYAEPCAIASFTMTYFLQWTAATVYSPAIFQLEAKAAAAAGTGVQLIAANTVSLKRWRLLT